MYLIRKCTNILLARDKKGAIDNNEMGFHCTSVHVLSLMSRNAG